MKTFLSIFLIGAVSSFALACRSSEKSKANPEARAGAGDSTSGQAASERQERPSLPTPHRLRGDEPSAEEGAGAGEDGERRYRRRFDDDGDRAESWERRRERLRDPEVRAAMRQERVNRMFGNLDSDGDGRISRGEFETGSDRMRRMLGDFDELDADGDSYVSTEELQAAMNRRFDRRFRDGDERRERRRERRERRQLEDE